MLMCADVHDVARCGNTERNVAFGLWLVVQPGLQRRLQVFFTVRSVSSALKPPHKPFVTET